MGVRLIPILASMPVLVLLIATGACLWVAGRRAKEEQDYAVSTTSALSPSAAGSSARRRRHSIYTRLVSEVPLESEGDDFSQPKAREIKYRTIALLVLNLVPLAYFTYILVLAIEPSADRTLLQRIYAPAVNLLGWMIAELLVGALLTRRLSYEIGMKPLQWFFFTTLALLSIDLWLRLDDMLEHHWTVDQYLFIGALITVLAIFATGITMPAELDFDYVLRHGYNYQNDKHARSPEATASFWSWLWFSWFTPLIKMGSAKTLNASDLPEMVPQLRARSAYGLFHNMRATGSLLRRIIIFNFASFTWQLCCVILSTFLDFATPFFLKRFLVEIAASSSEPKWAYLYIILIFVSQVSRSLVQSQMFYLGRRINVNLISTLNAEIYAKTLTRRDMSGLVDKKQKDGGGNKTKETAAKNEGSVGSASTGKIVNLMSTDTVRVAGVVNFAHMAVSSPIGIVIGTYLLYDLLGWSSLVGMAVLVVTMPINKKVRSYYAKAQRELSAARDERVTLVGELIQGIRMIKFFAWEMSFSAKCMKAREIELKKLVQLYKTIIVFQFVWYLSPLFVTLLTFVCYTKIYGGQFTPAVAFTAMVLFGRLKGPLNGLPAVYMALTNASVSLNRIADYLHEPDIQDKFANGDSSDAPIIGLKNLTAQWWTNDDGNRNDNKASGSQEEEPLIRVEDTDRFALRNLNVTFPFGEMSIICGSTGSGKSSLIMALLGEMDVLTGKIYLPRRSAGSRELDPETGLMNDGIAYVSQQAWLQNASIRDNILFGTKYEEDRYNNVVRVCALERDLEIFEDGDMTEIGEKGITLSGGQKQRVSLARAIYSRARHVLLDDCLSAVDAHTAEHIYSQCLVGPIMQHRTCILVTHHVRLCIPTAKHLVVMNNGTIEIQGSVQELRDKGVLARIMDEEEEHNITQPSDDETVGGDEELGGASNLAKPDFVRRKSTMDKKQRADKDKATALAPQAAAKDAKKLVQEETRQEGSVKWEIYKIYLNAVGGIPYWLLLLLSFIIVRLINISETLWVREWTNSYADSTFMRFMTTNLYKSFGMSASQHAFSSMPSDIPVDNNAGFGHGHDHSNISGFALADPKHSTNYYLTIYALISLIGSLAHIGNTVIVLYGSLRAARILYRKLLFSVVRAPLRFFDTTPVGRIMNRFGNDFETVDSVISNNFSQALELTLSILSIFVLLTFITPMFVVIAAVISLAYIYVGRLYINTSRELKRLHSVSRSPIYSLFGETLAGVSIVRAFGAQGRFMGDLLKTIDNSNRPFYFLWIANRWLSVRSDSIGAVVTLSSGLFILMNSVAIDAGTAGLALTYALEFVNLVNYLTREYTQLEVDLNSVERITEYSIMPQEPPAIIEGRRPPAAWPTGGSIEVKNLEIKYAPDLDTVLRGISFEVKPGEKVGVVGRTGSGKSTLALSLFRFVEPAAGSIHIDGINICDIGLDDLRSRLTIIPQDPMLFKGTIRSNLDPFGTHEDHELWEALRRVHLVGPTVNEVQSSANSVHEGNHDIGVVASEPDASTVASAAAGSNNNSGTTTPVGANVTFSSLDNPVSEGGTNFSQGQRQLLCMARALLRNTAITVMDEATASVDFNADSKIQKTIREEFANSTLICIAHRLRTIITYDRVLVLDHGKVKEYDTPANLLFGKGWDKSGMAASSSASITEFVGEEKTQFREMCERSGELEVLCELAREAEAKKRADH